MLAECTERGLIIIRTAVYIADLMTKCHACMHTQHLCLCTAALWVFHLTPVVCSQLKSCSSIFWSLGHSGSTSFSIHWQLAPSLHAWTANLESERYRRKWLVRERRENVGGEREREREREGGERTLTFMWALRVLFSSSKRWCVLSRLLTCDQNKGNLF